jgi:hypothetical protein
LPNLNAPLLQPGRQLIDSLVIGDINKLLIPGEPVLDKRDQCGHLFDRISIIE